MKKRNKLSPVFTTVLAAASLTSLATPHATNGPPRGKDVDPLASHCGIGTFPQTGKAGPYNALCNIMQDSEKCLALIKRQFRTQGDQVSVSKITDAEKLKRAEYCLEVLKDDLGL